MMPRRPIAAMVLSSTALAACAGLAGLGDYGQRADGGGGATGSVGGAGGTTGAGGAGGAAVTPLAVSAEWLRIYTGSGNAFAAGLAVDGNDNAVLCGHYKDALIADGELVPVQPAEFDTFVTRVDGGGASWTSFITGDGAQYCGGVVVEANETVVVGSFDGELILAGLPTMTSSPLTVFAARLNPTGEPVTTPTVTGNSGGPDLVIDVAEMPEGIAYGGAVVGPLSAANQTIGGTGAAPDAFVGRLFSAPNEWLFHIDDAPTGDAVQQTLSIDANRGSGRIAVGGETEGPLDLRRDPTADDTRGFVLSLDDDGNLQWARYVVGQGGALVWGVAIDATDDSTVIAGSYTGELTLGELTAPAVDGVEAYVAKLDATGEPIWLRTITANGEQNIWDVAVDGDGTILAVGDTSGTLDLGDGPLQTSVTTGFLWILSPDGTPRFGELVDADGTSSLRLVATRTPGTAFIAARIDAGSAVMFGDTVILDGASSPDIVFAKLALTPVP